MASKNIKTIPVYQKAESLYEISRHLVSYISFNKDIVKLYQSESLRDNIAESLLIDAQLISKNMAQALSSKSYSERIRNATLIEIMIRNINSYCRGLEYDGIKETEYVNLLRKELKLFRKSFFKWFYSLASSSDDITQ